jgi:hypothetical protein
LRSLSFSLSPFSLSLSLSLLVREYKEYGNSVSFVRFQWLAEITVFLPYRFEIPTATTHRTKSGILQRQYDIR